MSHLKTLKFVNTDISLPYVNLYALLILIHYDSIWNEDDVDNSDDDGDG